MFYGLLNLSFWGYVIAVLILTHITMISVTVYLHRCQSHRALELGPIPSHFFRFWNWLTSGMKTKAWVAVHRKHHAKCETEEDPHSPVVFGLAKVFWEGAELYRAEADNQKTLDQYGYGTPDDWLERNVYTPHYNMGIVLMFLIDLLLFGVPGITVWAVQMLWVPVFAAGVINGIGHHFGYRNYEVPDASRNMMPWGILICGEELHNNHHAYGTSAKLSTKWWEFDMGWFYIRTLSILGMAKVKHMAPIAKVDPLKKHLDAETVKAVIYTRFQLLAAYTRNVIIPTLREEKAKAEDASQKALRKAKKLLTSDKSFFTKRDNQRLADLLKTFHELRRAYQFQQKLQEIWARTSAKPHELLADLQAWCKEAEESGSRFLKDFADYIRSYTLPKLQAT